MKYLMMIQIVAAQNNQCKIQNYQDKIQKSLNKILNIQNKNQKYQTIQIKIYLIMIINKYRILIHLTKKI